MSNVVIYKDDKSTDYNLTVANRMFTGLGFNVKDEFKSIARATLDVKVKQLDFTEDGGRPAAGVINSWVSNKTDGKINEIISSGNETRQTSMPQTGQLKLISIRNCMNFFSDSLQNQTQIVMVNTVHFKSPWEIPFDIQETRRATFHLDSNDTTWAAMMTSEYPYSYADLHQLNATVVVVPYKVGQLT